MDKKHGHFTPPSGPSTTEATQPILSNQQGLKHQQPRQSVRHPAFYVFFTVWVVFLLFFFPSKAHDRNHESKLPIAPTGPPSVDPSLLPNSIPESQPKMSTEQTFIAIKPDGVQRGLVGSIISRFESRGYKLVAIKLVAPGKAHLEEHYADLKDKPFFAGLVEYMNSGPICAMVWEGRDAVKTGRTLLGATNPLASAPGTIRGDYAIDVGRNVCHGSDSVESAQKEIALWFKDGEVVSWKSAQASWIYEKP
ncbi:putative nucleoside diphosphate kinase [Rosellinia necatrix]|uniref:Nucleoside diphosphate kinase n=1 Tax=Rosellinia necatrix TaxID=77044 RepID=A0A1W2TVP9_ROSNE|nr:putative nucleoside diphosphate kinase [Rosellinia necatrix]